MQRIRAKLTKRLIDSLAPPTEGGSYIVSDTEDDGLRLRVFASGRKKFALEYRIAGRVRWFGLGRFGDLTVNDARERVRKLRPRITDGFDPAEAKAIGRDEPTFLEYAEGWTKRSKLRKKPSSLRNDELLLRLHLVPALGRRKLRSVTRADLARLRDKLSDRKTTANRVLALASTIFNAAEADGERDPNSNPCRHVERYKERRIERPLTGDDFARLWVALDTSDEAPAAVAAIRLLVLTGLRCGEALSLRWQDVDLDGARLQLRDSKTGARRVLLSAPAVELLRSVPQNGEFVFSGKLDRVTREERPLADLTHPWQRIRAKAGLSAIRLHDLRHSYASVAIGSGHSLPEVGKLLGHRNVATTARYAHLVEDAERRAVRSVGDAIARAIKPPRLRSVK